MRKVNSREGRVEFLGPSHPIALLFQSDNTLKNKARVLRVPKMREQIHDIEDIFARLLRTSSQSPRAVKRDRLQLSTTANSLLAYCPRQQNREIDCREHVDLFEPRPLQATQQSCSLPLNLSESPFLHH